jgi:hypothetical protein
MAKSSGETLATMLAGSWRCNPAPLECTAAELKEMTPLVLKSGAAALCWWRARHSDLRNTPAAAKLHQLYRQNILQSALHQQTIEQALALLRERGIDPVLVKGWAAARVYPDEGLRPRGDVDLCVRPGQYRAAEAALQGLKHRQYEIDLHRGFAKFGGGSFDEVYARAQLIGLGGTNVRVPCAEDHLRFISIHLLREGAWRPLWLCDVAAAVETRPEGFDWSLCLGRRADWVTCALRLTRELLDADLSDTPAGGKTGPLPRWIVQTVLNEWMSPQPPMKQRHLSPMVKYWSKPSNVWAGLRHRWPNPIEATVSAGGRFNRLPRLPFQVGTYLARGAKFAARLPKMLREH